MRNIFIPACYECKRALVKKTDTLSCIYCHKQYKIIDEIPVCLGRLNKSKLNQKSIYEYKAEQQEDISFNVLKDKLGLKFPRFLKQLVYFKLLKRMGLKKGKKLLDIGCFTGHNLNTLANNFNVEGYGVDLSLNALKQAKEYKEFKNKYIMADATKLPFPNNYFDYVISLDVIEHIPMKEKERFIKELIRVLKPGGNFIIYAVSSKNKYTFEWCQWWIRKNILKNLKGSQVFGWQKKSGHSPDKLINPDNMMKTIAKYCSFSKIIYFHAFFTLIFDVYIRMVFNAPFHAYLKLCNKNRIVLFESIYLFIYRLFYEIFLVTLSVLDYPWISKGYSNGFFIRGKK